ncbi:putative protease YhbU precursor [Limihaloglobus sulfuriphilus]|uniref:Putative protease YhbU n=1 Tax=Limihaloglobus sulfuriphilus TaxID=1851148 RepID=A0A1Q2MHU1_9BACT|nr:peptidase U32 family protein [Limihaloglobus sulfuriphilus]AQQ72261.1 putative protease YhbU precursor [Limihaloglobus sulfuriphilus]
MTLSIRSTENIFISGNTADMPHQKNKPELLAPAGGPEALKAAVEAGADAVYLGLNCLNARRGAENFSLSALRGAVEYARKNGVKVFLTLNTMVSCRETGVAARILHAASDTGVDAVLVTDPMFLPLIRLYPSISFHFSTQAAIENSAAISAAKELGLSRAVLARELSEQEIQACCDVDGIESEVFIQGALCFSVSGRCLMSSWGGGRSGNRGTCTSPCRAIWRINGQNPQRRMSMHDLEMAPHIQKLGQLGVSCLKIEGRLKKAQWVSRAVSAYRKLLDGDTLEEVSALLKPLGDYTGRDMTSGYFDGQRTDMCGESGRTPSNEETAARIPQSELNPTEEENDETVFHLKVKTGSGRIECEVISENVDSDAGNFDMPLTAVKKARRGLPASTIEKNLQETEIEGYKLGTCSFDQPALIMAKRNISAVVEKTAAILRTSAKRPTREIQGIDLPQNVRDIIERKKPDPRNKKELGERVDALRVDYEKLPLMGKLLFQFKKIIIENIPTEDSKLQKAVMSLPKQCVIALPPVFYEDRLPAYRKLTIAAAKYGIAVEVNSWGGFYLARQSGARCCAGPGMAILNHTAALAYKQIGIDSAYISIEADKKQIEQLCSCSPLPLTMYVYGFPALMYTRAAGKCFSPDAVLEDERGIKIRPSKSLGGLTVLRSAEPMCLLDTKNPRIRVNSLAVDTVGINDNENLIQTIKALIHRRIPPMQPGIRFNRFNYNRTLA